MLDCISTEPALDIENGTDCRASLLPSVQLFGLDGGEDETAQGAQPRSNADSDGVASRAASNGANHAGERLPERGGTDTRTFQSVAEEFQREEDGGYREGENKVHGAADGSGYRASQGAVTGCRSPLPRRWHPVDSQSTDTTIGYAA